MSPPSYPSLRLRPIAVPRVWGGRRLIEDIHPELNGASSDPIGETWECSDVGDDPAIHSVVEEGPHAGQTLRSLIEDDPVGMLGRQVFREGSSPRLPLLYKLIDAREALSVQVHPSDELVAEHGLPGAGKTEAWLILAADPEAYIIYGLDEGLDYPTYLARARAGRGEEGLRRRSVRAGDLVYLPAGTLHAIGGGLLLAEIQQSSDTTYRIHDWGRVGLDGRPRTLHLDEAALCRPPESIPPCPFESIDPPGTPWRHRVSGAPFEVREIRGPAEIRTPETKTRFGILSILEGIAETWAPGEPPMTWGRGTTFFLPAASESPWLRLPDDGWAVWMAPVRV